MVIPVKTQTTNENIEHFVQGWTLIFGQLKEIIFDNHPGFTKAQISFTRYGNTSIARSLMEHGTPFIKGRKI